ncbi:MAG TPA: hypothetical protein PLU94_04020 [Methanoregulaceae archaeon]|nr:hypothetical protein [Methanoregulaceae archaeon]
MGSSMVVTLNLPRLAYRATGFNTFIARACEQPLRYIRDELFPALEVASRESGRDPNTIERVGHFSYVYDPDQVVRLEQ